MSCEIHKGDVGTKMLVTVTDCDVAVDISTADYLSIFIKKPDGTILTRTGTLETDGTDGKMHYVIVSGDLDVAGSYKLQGRVVFSGLSSYYTSTATFRVERNL